MTKIASDGRVDYRLPEWSTIDPYDGLDYRAPRPKPEVDNMSWQKREVDTNLVILGDAEGNVRKANGLLASITPDQRYPDNRRYALIQADGTVKSVAGSASINSQLGPGDVGKFVKLDFTGWGSGSNGKFKKIDVQVYEGEPTEQMKAWPRYAELHGAAKPNSDPGPAAPGVDEDDDLPF